MNTTGQSQGGVSFRRVNGGGGEDKKSDLSLTYKAFNREVVLLSCGGLNSRFLMSNYQTAK